MSVDNNEVSDKENCIEGYQKPIRQGRLDTKDGRVACMKFWSGFGP